MFFPKHWICICALGARDMTICLWTKVYISWEYLMTLLSVVKCWSRSVVSEILRWGSLRFMAKTKTLLTENLIINKPEHENTLPAGFPLRPKSQGELGWLIWGNWNLGDPIKSTFGPGQSLGSILWSSVPSESPSNVLLDACIQGKLAGS